MIMPSSETENRAPKKIEWFARENKWPHAMSNTLQIKDSERLAPSFGDMIGSSAPILHYVYRGVSGDAFV